MKARRVIIVVLVAAILICIGAIVLSTTTNDQSETVRSPRPTLERESELERVWDTYEANVPERWKGRIKPEFHIVAGNTSLAYSPNRIEISEYHANSSDEYLSVIVTHEYGHLIAFNFGSGAYYGAPPEGWPPRTDKPEEHWADCVSQVFTGIVEPVPGLPPCEGAQLSWADDWLKQ